MKERDTPVIERCNEYNSYMVELGERGPYAGCCILDKNHEGPHVSFSGRTWDKEENEPCR